MHFNLPDQLALEVTCQTWLAAVMAAEDRKAKKKNTSQRRAFEPYPSDIVNDRTWNEVVDKINLKSVKQGK